MKTKNFPPELRSQLLIVVSKRLDELLLDANFDASLFGELRKAFHKLDMLVVVSYDSWSKWPWKRTPVSFHSDLYERAQRQRITDLVAPQIVDLMLREMSENSQKVLFHLRKDNLLAALNRFYINEFTGDAVARLILQLAVDSVMEEEGVLTREALKEMFCSGRRGHKGL
ncbi:MAG: hypothetical protein DKT66_09230 [Candidatus Melainabacteria bacterium]|nr:MAG: hypothetical protein DKT66_09230 [Candidatus Melainabacteria bacterium]